MIIFQSRFIVHQDFRQKAALKGKLVSWKDETQRKTMTALSVLSKINKNNFQSDCHRTQQAHRTPEILNKESLCCTNCMVIKSCVITKEARRHEAE